jgi:hypothetical protein
MRRSRRKTKPAIKPINAPFGFTIERLPHGGFLIHERALSGDYEHGKFTSPLFASSDVKEALGWLKAQLTATPEQKP